VGLEEFYEQYPWPDKSGLSSLFRFMRIDTSNPNFIEHIFVRKKLYHSTPDNFNDPFECKPHFTLDENAKKIRNHLIKITISYGRSRKESEILISNLMKNPKFVKDAIMEATKKSFGAMRICCFTTDKNNLLFWSHYADSHMGFCMEFDATVMPISMAYKVKYSNDYPVIEYPITEDARALKPALIKSMDWKYEDEYRSVFIPTVNRLQHDGESLHLQGHEIKKVFLGARILEDSKTLLLQIIKESEFNPIIYQARLSNTSFKLKYEQIS